MDDGFVNIIFEGEVRRAARFAQTCVQLVRKLLFVAVRFLLSDTETIW